ncbi:1879_t:CDS:2, partial [Racocetra persica]
CPNTLEIPASYNFTDTVCSHQAVPTLCIRLTPECYKSKVEKNRLVGLLTTNRLYF